MLVNQVWQPLAGTRQAHVFPYLRTPDLLSSNSCLIRTPELILLIDAGALESQTADLGRVLAECRRERSRPVVVCLTHCHIDHSLHADRCRQVAAPDPIWLAVHEQGAASLTAGDPKSTVAELYGMAFPPMQPDIRLLAAQDQESGPPRSIRLAPDAMLTLRTESLSTGPGQPWLVQTLSLGGGDELEVYPAPGHSPDSICLRAGEILFIGDLLVAANPMVAGISGWSRDDLLNTLQQVQWLLDNRPIRLCYPGHGKILPADKVRDILQRMQQKTSRLGEVARMDGDRLFQITDFAMELIDEAEEVFSSIAGRVLYVAYQLEQLEEEDAAGRCRAAMDMDAIDACLLEFRTLCRSLDAGEIRRVEFAHGALRIVEKIRSLFDPRPLAAILPQSLINRGTSLLLDFVGIANGCRNAEEFIPTDVNSLIEDVAQAWQASPHQDASVIDCADDYDKYLAALVLRIGHVPAAERPALLFSPHDGLPFARIAAGRFFNTLLSFLEWLGQGDPSSIDLATGLDGAGLFVTASTRGRDGLPPTAHEEKQTHSFIRRFRLCGLVLQRQNDSFRLTLVDDSGEEERRPPSHA